VRACVCVHTFCNQIFSVFFCLVAVTNFVGDVQTLQHCQETAPPPSTSNSILSIPWSLLLCLNLLEQEFLLGGKKKKKRRERKKERKKKQKRSNQIVCTVLTRFLSLSNYPPAATTCVFQLNKTFVMVLDSPWQLRYTELKWCRLKVLHRPENKVHVEGGNIYLLLSRKTMIKMHLHWKTKVHPCGMWSFVNYDEDIRNLITRRNLERKIHPGLAFSRHRKTLSFWWIGGAYHHLLHKCSKSSSTPTPSLGMYVVALFITSNMV